MVSRSDIRNNAIISTFFSLFSYVHNLSYYSLSDSLYLYVIQSVLESCFVFFSIQLCLSASVFIVNFYYLSITLPYFMSLSQLSYLCLSFPPCLSLSISFSLSLSVCLSLSLSISLYLCLFLSLGLIVTFV